MNTDHTELSRNSASDMTFSANSKSRFSPITAACALICGAFAGAAQAQTPPSSFQPVVPGVINSQQTTPSGVLRGAIGGVDFSVNADVARLTVEVEKDDLPADGQSTNGITIRLFDKSGAPLKGEALITVEHSAGRILISGASTDELGPGRRDIDKVTPGVQLKVIDGVATFKLLAPTEPTEVKMRVTAGSAVAEGTVSYLPELREMVAAGLIEGIINFKRKSSAEILPVRIDDGFERELDRWTREFNNGKGNAGLRTAFFIKGKVKGDLLLTMAADSDKDTKSRLLRDIDPNRFYPVYGDSAITGFDARSRSRMYVRLDSGKSYALWGDFSTGDGFSQLTGGGTVASSKTRDLGSYNRSATGLRAHYEQPGYFVNGFAFSDNLKQLVEEYRGNGTSGPFSVASNAGLANSEKVEIITRDKNALGLVKTVQLMQRLVDYSFEPFSGRILFKSPVPSLDINGDPVSIRITYEVEQGGPSFMTYGVDGQARLGERVEVGGSIVKDENPGSPYTLNSINATLRLGAVGSLTNSGSLVVEVANSKSTRYTVAGLSTQTGSGAAGEVREDRSGSAIRLEANYKISDLDARGWYSRADRNFFNSAASISEGREEAGLSGRYALRPNLSIYAMARQSKDRSVSNEPSRESLAVGATWLTTERLKLDFSLRHTREDAGFTGESTISNNSAIGGGFFGLGANAVNPITGTAVLGSSGSNSVAGGGLNPDNLSSTSVRINADYRITDQWTLAAEVESGTKAQNRWGAGANYQINERSRLYARYEQRTGLSSASSLNPSDRANSFVTGIDNTFASGPTVYSEFRMRDSISSDTALARDMQLGSGVRHSWNYAPGITYTAGAEYLRILSGINRDAFAINGGIDYSVDPLWRASARLEYRRVFDDKSTAADDTQDQYLSTVSVARKIDRDWTLLARNYLLYQNNHSAGTRLEDRFQIGAAWRPVDHNRWNALARYEFKTVRDAAAAAAVSGDNYRAHILSLHGDYHPTRPWWFNGKAAAKVTTDKTLPSGQQGYSAYLLSGRATYDVNEKWDVGVMSSYMYSPQGSSKQWAQGAELGYLLQTNLWLSLGVNWRGFSDRELTGSDYTNRGVYVRLRFKFDGDLLNGKDTDVNRALNR
jgi:hypothetical protein